MGFYTDLQAMKLRFSSKYYDMTLANNYELKELIDNNIAITVELSRNVQSENTQNLG